MRLVIQGKELEFRVQERRVTTCSVFHKGKEIAGDISIHAPQDPYDQREGERIAVERAALQLFERQQRERQDAMKVFTKVGALSGNVELPSLEPPQSIVQKIMAKLDQRRERKAKESTKDTPAKAKEQLDSFYKEQMAPRTRFVFASLFGTKP